MTLRFSIIIPAYNCEATIEKCIKSLEDQNYPYLEIICVDDHSSDNTVEVISKLKKEFTNIQLFTNDGKGVSSARNKGLQNARGDIIGFCDADDYVANDSLNNINYFFDKYSVDVVVTEFCDVNNNTRLQNSINNKKKIVNGDWLCKAVINNDLVRGSVWNKYFRRDFIGNAFFNSALTHMEDTAFLVNILSKKRNAKVGIINKPLYYYVNNSNSAIHDVRRLFNNYDELQYSVSINYMLENFSLTWKERVLLKRKDFILSVLTLHDYQLDSKYVKSLRKKIRKNQKYFVLTCWKNPKQSIWIIKELLEVRYKV